MKICNVEKCNSKHVAKGFCAIHYRRFLKYGDPLKVFIKEKKKCIIIDCNNYNQFYGLCGKHHRRKISNGDPNIVKVQKIHQEFCKIKGCNRPYKGKGYCNLHYLRAFNLIASQKRLIIKKIVIWHYSNGTMKCACCGESLIEGLSIDHPNGDGSYQRRKNGYKSGTAFYIWLIKNNLPSGFGVLCGTCNQAKGTKPICPHKLE